MSTLRSSIEIFEKSKITIDGSDGDYASVEFFLKISNSGKTEWQGVNITALLTDDLGTPIANYNSTTSQSIGPGEVFDASGGFYMVSRHLLPSDASKLKVIVFASSLKASSLRRIELKLPSKPFEITRHQLLRSSDDILPDSIAVWISNPDQDKEVNLEVAVSYVNNSSEYIPELKVKANLLNKNGADFDEFDRVCEVPPGTASILNASTSSKLSKLKGGSILLELSESRVDSCKMFILT